MTCSVGQRIDVRTLRIFDIFKMENGSTPEICDKIIAKYPDFMFKMDVTGDSTGHNRTPMLEGEVNHYIIIKRKLKLKDHNLKVRSKNLALSASQILCNSVLQNAEIEISEHLEELINDVSTSETDDEGDLIKTKNQGRHFFDNFRYMVDAIFPDFIDKPHLYKKK